MIAYHRRAEAVVREGIVLLTLGVSQMAMATAAVVSFLDAGAGPAFYAFAGVATLLTLGSVVRKVVLRDRSIVKGEDS